MTSPEWTSGDAELSDDAPDISSSWLIYRYSAESLQLAYQTSRSTWPAGTGILSGIGSPQLRYWYYDGDDLRLFEASSRPPRRLRTRNNRPEVDWWDATDEVWLLAFYGTVGADHPATSWTIAAPLIAALSLGNFVDFPAPATDAYGAAYAGPMGPSDTGRQDQRIVQRRSIPPSTNCLCIDNRYFFPVDSRATGNDRIWSAIPWNHHPARYWAGNLANRACWDGLPDDPAAGEKTYADFIGSGEQSDEYYIFYDPDNSRWEMWTDESLVCHSSATDPATAAWSDGQNSHAWDSQILDLTDRAAISYDLPDSSGNLCRLVLAAGVYRLALEPSYRDDSRPNWRAWPTPTDITLAQAHILSEEAAWRSGSVDAMVDHSEGIYATDSLRPGYLSAPVTMLGELQRIGTYVGAATHDSGDLTNGGISAAQIYCTKKTAIPLWYSDPADQSTYQWNYEGAYDQGYYVEDAPDLAPTSPTGDPGDDGMLIGWNDGANDRNDGESYKWSYYDSVPGGGYSSETVAAIVEASATLIDAPSWTYAKRSPTSRLISASLPTNSGSIIYTDLVNIDTLALYGLDAGDWPITAKITKTTAQQGIAQATLPD